MTAFEYDRIVVRPDQGRVVVRAQGPTGASGGSASAYVHTQTVASAAWDVSHGLGYRPSVELLDAGGSEIDAQVVHLSVNQLQVFLSTPSAGEARCQ